MNFDFQSSYSVHFIFVFKVDQIVNFIIIQALCCVGDKLVGFLGQALTKIVRVGKYSLVDIVNVQKIRLLSITLVVYGAVVCLDAANFAKYTSNKNG